ncbi:MAG: HNH endonuclease family protein [Dermatophilaceae bacterium]
MSGSLFHTTTRRLRNHGVSSRRMPTARPVTAAAVVSSAVVAALLALGAATPASADAPAPASASTSASSDTFSGSLTEAIAEVVDASERNSGYDRDLFPHWSDLDGDCRDTRHEVLVSEAEPDTPLTYTSSARCSVDTGRWFSYYDRVSWTDASDLDVDHLVPLAEAWGSGASGWSTDQREDYANDIGDRRTLVAVTDDVNQAKSDKDPAEWLPTYDRCRYVAEWVAVKIRWGLTADDAERATLQDQAGSCTSTTLAVTRA